MASTASAPSAATSPPAAGRDGGRRLAYLGEAPDVPGTREISFRRLRHYASSVRHQKYHGVDIVMVHVDGPR